MTHRRLLQSRVPSTVIEAIKRRAVLEGGTMSATTGRLLLEAMAAEPFQRRLAWLEQHRAPHAGLERRLVQTRLPIEYALRLERAAYLEVTSESALMVSLLIDVIGSQEFAQQQQALEERRRRTLEETNGEA